MTQGDGLPKPPYLGERVLGLLVSQDDRETVLGDFAEEFGLMFSHAGRRRARRWYWFQIFRSAPALGQLKFARQVERSWLTMSRSRSRRDMWFVLLGALFLIPALLIGIPGMLQSGLAVTAPNDLLYDLRGQLPFLQILIHPFVILGGLFLALALNAMAIFGVTLERRDDSLVGTVTVRGGLIHWAVILASLFFLAVMFTYALAENFQIFAR